MQKIKNDRRKSISHLLKYYLISGGPVVAYEDNAFEDKFGRFVLMGTIHGAFFECSNDLPGIYVEVDDSSILEFLYKEAYSSGWLRKLF